MEHADHLEKTLEDYKTKVSTDVRGTVELDRDLIFTGRTSGGYTIEYDAKVEWGIMPTESLLLSVAACMAIDMVSFLRKMHCEISSFKIETLGNRNPTPPQYFTAFNLMVRIKGKGIDDRKMQRAIALSKDKYCSVFHTLRKDMEHTVKYEITHE